MSCKPVKYLVASACVVAALTAAVVVPAPEASRPQARSSPEMTEECLKSVEVGFDWLISVMNIDGGVGPDVDRPSELGCTAMFGLALLSEGNTPLGGPHRKELRTVLHAVLDMLDRRSIDRLLEEETLVQRKIGRHAELFIATLFLTQVYGEAPDEQKDIKRSLEKLVVALGRAQGADGTWGSESWAPVLGTVLGWESLRAASSCGLPVDASAKLAGDALYKQLREKRADPRGLMHNFYKTAASIRVLHSLDYRDDPVFESCVAEVLRDARSDSQLFTIAGGEEFLAFFFVTECLLKEPDEAWQAWYPNVSKNLIRIQNQDGSWSGHHCITGRTFCTAGALMTLLSRNLCLPISEL